MDRQDNSRQSSLPSSLIPHLYTAPRQPRDSSTRTTLDYEDHRPVSPPFSLYASPYPTSWREGEAGPSSLAQPFPRSPLRLPEVFPSSRYDDYYTRETERDYWPTPGQSTSYNNNNNNPQHQTTFPTPYSNFQPLPPPQQLLTPKIEEPTPSPFLFDRNDAYSYPPVGSLSISAPTSSRFRTPESPDIRYSVRSDSHSADLASNDGEGSQGGKRGRAESLEADDNSGKARSTRKTPVACNFCRGRKLRCNGARPSCYNCTVRKFECEYVPVQRRRGPGKAPRGSRSRKAASTRTDPAGGSRNTGDHPSSAELEALAPELRPYTSVLSLGGFGIQASPSDISPQYPDPRIMGEQYWSRDSSPEPNLYRKMG